MLIVCQKYHFPALPIFRTILNVSALVTNAIISNKMFGNTPRSENWSKCRMLALSYRAGDLHPVCQAGFYDHLYSAVLLSTLSTFHHDKKTSLLPAVPGRLF